MAAFDFLRSKNRASRTRRRRRKTEAGSALLRFLESSRLVTIGVFCLTVAFIFIISFVGVSPTAFHLLPNQKSTVRIISDANFKYESQIQTERQRARVRQEIPPVYHIQLDDLDEFEQQIREVIGVLNRLDATWQSIPEAERLKELTSAVDAVNTEVTFQISVRDLLTLMNFGDANSRTKLIENALYVLREIMRGGVYNPDTSTVPSGQRELMMFHVERDSGQVAQTRVTSFEEALTFLRANLNNENVPQPVVVALMRLLRPGLRENLEFDPEKTAALREQRLAELKPVVVEVEEGRSIVEPNTVVTPEQYEMLNAYQRHLVETSDLPTGIDSQSIARILLVVGMIIVAGFYIRIEDPMTLTSNGRLALLASVLVVSLGLVRGMLELGSSEVFSTAPETAALLPYVAPMAFAPMVIGILIGAGPAFFCGLLISVFSAVIFGNRLELLVLALLATSVAVYACRSVRRRSRVMRAGWVSGLVVAAFVFLWGWIEGMESELIIKAVIGAQLIGFLTGIMVVGLLPILESLFKRTTDITLLELTDYNHPLLRRMQMDAPGTYHHSLMVANLSENAANEIGANALLCRVCCMFHDIGKLVKPEYFTENQRDGVNPHAERTPSFSALIIKSHVKEGVDLAIKYKLPRPVIDVIRQHHGTTLIRYFFEQARKKAQQSKTGTTPDPTAANESSYRYDGPKPQFKESAIILFADSVEAASRSLQKVTPQAVEDLIDDIIREKIDDGQIDESPLTTQEISRIKRSFTFTLLNSLHTRVIYPKADKEPQPARTERRETAPTTEAAPVGSR